MKVFGISIAHEEIEVDEQEFRAALQEDEVGNLLDTQLSDLRGGGTVVVDDRRVIDPYDDLPDGMDLLKLLTPVLEHVPTEKIYGYVIGRMMADVEKLESFKPTGIIQQELKYPVSPRGYISGVDYGPCIGGCVPSLPCRMPGRVREGQRHWFDNPRNVDAVKHYFPERNA